MRGATEISAKRRRFAEEYVLDGNATAAAIRAGYSTRSAHVTACRMLKEPDVQAALAERQAAIAADLELDRQRVIAEIMAAIDVARMKADPHAMIKGWAEIAKMMGFYEPERKRIDVSLSAKRMIDQFEAMTDQELLRIVEQPAAAD